MSAIFAAARTDDVAKFDSVIASDFYIFDGGTRFNGDAIMAFIKAQHAAGRRYEWNVTEPDVHVSCNTAWITYTNEGSITDASGTTNQNWLESAFLEKQAGTWKVIFMHSTRVPRTSRNPVSGQLPNSRQSASVAHFREAPHPLSGGLLRIGE
jgi:ketosteroid isomerase-like protein